MREIIKSLFVVVLSFGLVITLTVAYMGSSDQVAKAKSGKIRIIAVDAFSDLSRNLTSDSSAPTGTNNGTG